MFVQPRSRLRPEENCRPEADEVVVDVPDEVRLTAKLASPLEAPPVKPSPALTAVMSPLEDEDEEIVIVDPDVLIEVPPEAAIVIAPVVLFKDVTSSVVSRETVGFWPAVTAIPVPPVKP